MKDKEKLHQILSSLWKNDDSIGKTYYNQALQDVQIAIDSLQEEPVSAELIEELKKIVNIRECVSQGVPVIKIARHFAQWQKEQMMKDSVLCGVDGWFINNDRNCRKNGRFYKYYVSTISHDKPLPMENGKDYRLITIKED